MSRHQKLRSDDMSSSPWANYAAKADIESSCLASPTDFNASSSHLLSRGSLKASLMARESSLDGSGKLPGSTSPGGVSSLRQAGSWREGQDEPFQTTVHEQAFTYRGVKVRVKSTPNILSWKPASGSSSCCLDLSSRCRKLPYDEILGVWQVPQTRLCDMGLCPTEYVLVVYAVGRKKGQPCKWYLEEHQLVASSVEQAKDWVAIINTSLQRCHDRPRHLLVLINPYSGAKRSRIVWEQKARPVFEKAHIKYSLVETLHPDHAREVVANLKPDELAQYQGIVAVGGDGVFQECVMGLMAQRALGGGHLAAACRVRVGHIPGGSTDAVACSLNGTRCAETAALHVALGDRLALDVAHIACQPSSQEMQGAEVQCMAAPVAMGMAAPPPRPDGVQQPGGGKGGGGGKGQDADELLRQSTGTCCTEVTNDSEAKEQTMIGGGDGSGKLGGSSAAGGGGGGPKGSGGGGSGQGSHQQRGGGTGQDGGKGGGSSGSGGLGGAGQRGDRPRSRHYVCQAAYGFLGDVMCLSEGLRFMGPSRYDLAGFLQLVKLQSYRLQILYKPFAQPLQADAQDVCSYKCEVCRLAGLSMLNEAQGAHELATPNGTPSKPSATSPIPRPPLPPSLYMPPTPTSSRPVQSPGASRGHLSRSPNRRAPSPSSTCNFNPSYQAPQGPSPAATPSKFALDVQCATHPCPPTLPPSSPSNRASGASLEPPGGETTRNMMGRGGPTGLCGLGQTSCSNAQWGECGGASLSATEGGWQPDSPHGVPTSSDSGSGTALLGGGSGGGSGGGTAALEGGRLSVAQQMLERSGVSRSDARTGCSAGAMHRLCEDSEGRPLTEEGWVATEGEYVSVMAVATSCRSDMTKKGIVPNAHLSDGRIYLILVSKCNRLDYLRFLIRLSTKGLHDNCFPFVKVVPVTAVIINPLPPPPVSPLYASLLSRCCPPPAHLRICSGESAWNVDGELLPHNAVRIGITRGAVDVFARGVELVAPSL